MNKCQKRWVYVIIGCYYFIFIFFIGGWKEEDIPNYDGYSELYKNNESIVKSIKKSEKNFKHYENSRYLSHAILMLVLY